MRLLGKSMTLSRGSPITGEAAPQVPGLLTDRGVVDLGHRQAELHSALVMEGIIDDFDRLRPTLAQLVQNAPALPLSVVRLRAPLPRPRKILCALAN
jgi:hypothetical protein